MQAEEARSLYERLGGAYSIAVVVDDFIDRIMSDSRLNANPRVTIALRREDEERLGEVHLPRQPLHTLCRVVARVRKDTELVALERRVGEDVDNEVGSARTRPVPSRKVSICAWLAHGSGILPQLRRRPPGLGVPTTFCQFSGAADPALKLSRSCHSPASTAVA